MEDISIQEFYEWAKSHNLLDFKMRVQYRDEGGSYFGTDKELYCEVDWKNKVIIL